MTRDRQRWKSGRRVFVARSDNTKRAHFTVNRRRRRDFPAEGANCLRISFFGTEAGLKKRKEGRSETFRAFPLEVKRKLFYSL